MKKLLLSLTISFLAVTNSTAQKFAYVDTDYILTKIPEFQQAQDKLDAISSDWQKDIENELVDAYMARRALDYLVGFNISPILWTKLPGSKSAGRVQSVALRLLTEREHEIEVFQPEEFWTLNVNFLTKDNLKITTNMIKISRIVGISFI